MVQEFGPKGILTSFANHLNSNSDVVLTVPAYHLGWDKQAISVNQGYNQEIEDRMLEKIKWPSKTLIFMRYLILLDQIGVQMLFKQNQTAFLYQKTCLIKLVVMMKDYLCQVAVLQPKNFQKSR